LPLILAAVDEYHHLFQQISDNPNLLPEAFAVNPDSISDDRLREEAWKKLLSRHYQQELDKIANDFRTAQGTSTDPTSRSGCAGRSLFIASGLL